MKCVVCQQSIIDDFRSCVRCDLRHHPDCWDYLGRCGAYGCQPQRTEVAIEEPTLIADEEPTLIILAVPESRVEFSFFGFKFGFRKPSTGDCIRSMIALWAIGSFSPNTWGCGIGLCAFVVMQPYFSTK